MSPLYPPPISPLRFEPQITVCTQGGETDCTDLPSDHSRLQQCGLQCVLLHHTQKHGRPCPKHENARHASHKTRARRVDHTYYNLAHSKRAGAQRSPRAGKAACAAARLRTAETRLQVEHARVLTRTHAHTTSADTWCSGGDDDSSSTGIGHERGGGNAPGWPAGRTGRTYKNLQQLACAKGARRTCDWGVERHTHAHSP